jgi:CubicO group peptidase (beta-lactamase class C family)
MWLGVLLLSFGLPVFAAEQKAAVDEVEKKIEVFENGLYPMPQGPADPKAPAPKAQTLIERMAFYKVPGVSLAVIDEFKIQWSKGYGEIKAGSGKAVTEATIFEAASTTKALVAAVVLHFVDKGRFDLDADVNTYLKSWQVPENEFTKEKKVTLRLLLTHQAGLPTTNMGYDEQAGVPTLVQVLKGEAPARNKAAVPELIPGSKWQYSNVGYALIQLILEDALGQKLEAIMAETLFNPLGLRTTTLYYPLPASLQEREALPHDEKGQAAAPALHFTAQAQGGLLSTPRELAVVAIELMQAYRGTSRRLLSQEMAQTMFQAAVDLDPRIFGSPVSDGLGIFVKGKGPTLTFLHPGNNFPGSICWLVGFPEQGKGAVVMLNGANGEMLALEILVALAGLYQWPPLL